jgi:DNA-binding NtrC family response regulator
VLLTSTTRDAITLESFPSVMMSAPVMAIQPSSASRAPGGPLAYATMPPPSPPDPETGSFIPDEETTANLASGQLERIILAEPDERTRVLAALAACHGNQTSAAKLLGVSRRTLVNRIIEFELPRPRKK